MPARKRRKQKNRSKNLIKAVFCVVLFLSVIYLGIILVKTKVWSRELGTVVATNLEESVAVFIFNPLNQQSVKIIIPKNTEVDVSRNLGRWKLGNVSELGANEGVGGKLLKQTLVKNLYFPAVASSSPEIDKIYSKKVTGIIPFLFSGSNESTSFADRLRIILFSFNVKDSQISEINLKDSPYLQSLTLTDGNPGYLVTNNFPKSLLPLFSINKEGEIENVIIVSKTINTFDFERATQIIEVMGFKVVSIEKTDTLNDLKGCAVFSINRSRGERIARVFDCVWENSDDNDSQEIKVVFGEDYFEEF